MNSKDPEDNVYINDQAQIGKKKRFLKMLEPQERLVWSGKLNKINRKGDPQPRVFILTTDRCINFGVKKKGFFRRIFGKTLQRTVNFINIESIIYSMTSFKFILHVEDEQFDYAMESSLRDEFLGILLILSEQSNPEGFWFYFVKETDIIKYSKSPGSNEVIVPKVQPVRMNQSDFQNFKKKNATVLNIGELSESKVQNNQHNESSYSLIKLIGKNQNSKSFICKNVLDEKYYAVKIINKFEIIKKNQIDILVREQQIKQKIHSPFLNPIKHVFTNQSHVFLIMDYLSCGNLKQYLDTRQKFNEKETKYIVQQVLELMCELHKQNILFRNYSPEIIYLNEKGTCKITDLSTARGIDINEKRKTKISFSSYCPPEFLKYHQYDKNMEIWQFGCLIYELCQGHSPFSDLDADEMFQNIKAAKFQFNNKIQISEELQDLILSVRLKVYLSKTRKKIRL